MSGVSRVKTQLKLSIDLLVYLVSLSWIVEALELQVILGECENPLGLSITILGYILQQAFVGVLPAKGF
jgi:hypothetical protein